jgi:hypothetical protein
VTLSHEALELVGDPEVNLLVKGPHPNRNERREVFHWFEMCDVQAETCDIDGDALAKDRMRIKLKLKGARRANRYRKPTEATLANPNGRKKPRRKNGRKK